MKEHIAFLAEYIDKGGPDETERPLVDQWIESVSTAIQNQTFSLDEIEHFYQFFGKSLPIETMYGLSYHKPHGYPGDFEIIDKIFTHYLCPQEKYTNWDTYYQNRGSARAVRNRKDYFKRLLREKMEAYPEGFQVLNIASGPCRDILEFLEENPDANVSISCIETDRNCIDYASSLLKNHLDKVSFIHTNIFKFKPDQKYHFIWSAGLYDYFNDAAFIGVTKKLLQYCQKEGEIVIGNFAKTSPDVFYMHIVKWMLYYRNPDDLRTLAQACGVPSSCTETYVGNEKVSLIFHMRPEN